LTEILGRQEQAGVRFRIGIPMLDTDADGGADRVTGGFCRLLDCFGSKGGSPSPCPLRRAGVGGTRRVRLLDPGESLARPVEGTADNVVAVIVDDVDTGDGDTAFGGGEFEQFHHLS